MAGNLSRAGLQPGAFGLKGSAGLQLKAPAKKYGLQKPLKRFGGCTVFASADDDLDDEQESVGMAAMRQSKQAAAAAAAVQRAAVAEDASVFDYDGVYEEMARAKERQREALGPGAAGMASSASEHKRLGPRYISSIMEAHKEREIENDKIFERKMVKEAEEEAHLYAGLELWAG